jgi:hypothetical protein
MPIVDWSLTSSRLVWSTLDVVRADPWVNSGRCLGQLKLPPAAVSWIKLTSASGRPDLELTKIVDN